MSKLKNLVLGTAALLSVAAGNVGAEESSKEELYAINYRAANGYVLNVYSSEPNKFDFALHCVKLKTGNGADVLAKDKTGKWYFTRRRIEMKNYKGIISLLDSMEDTTFYIPFNKFGQNSFKLKEIHSMKEEFYKPSGKRRTHIPFAILTRREYESKSWDNNFSSQCLKTLNNC